MQLYNYDNKSSDALNDHVLFFTGFAASTSYDVAGGGINYQCLSLSPQFDNTGGGGDLYAFISGC